MASEKIYGVADKAWQVVVGCDPHMPCAPRCWARTTVARIVECQLVSHPGRAEFFRAALSPDGKRWSGDVLLDEAHLMDPLRWSKPALIATGFHGDWGRLSNENRDRLAAVMALCPQHRFMPLTKHPDGIVEWCERLERMVNEWRPQTKTGKFSSADVLNLRWMHGTFGRGPAFPNQPWPLPNVSIGCSVMNQSEADRMRRSMANLAAMGWRTHCWYEPALGPVNWNGWEFLGGIICGGESGPGARRFEEQWASDTLRWCREHAVPFWMKQGGSQPSFGVKPDDPKAQELASLPEHLRVRELPR